MRLGLATLYKLFSILEDEESDWFVFCSSKLIISVADFIPSYTEVEETTSFLERICRYWNIVLWSFPLES
jgi:hypothetical protein